MSLPVMPSTHTWVQGGPVLEKAGRNTLYASDSEVVWVWNEDTGVQVTDLRDANGNTISVVPIVNGWVTGVGVPVSVVLPSFSVGQTGPHYSALPIQTIRGAANVPATYVSNVKSAKSRFRTPADATDGTYASSQPAPGGSTIQPLQRDPNFTGANGTGRLWGWQGSNFGFTDDDGATWTSTGALPSSISTNTPVQVEFSPNYLWLVDGLGTAGQIGRVWRSPLPSSSGSGISWTKVMDLNGLANGPGSATAYAGAGTCFRNQSFAIQPDESYAYLLEYGSGSFTGNPSSFTDGMMSAASNMLYSPSGGANFQGWHVFGGYTITIPGAGPAGASLVTTVVEVLNNKMARLADCAQTAVSGASVSYTSKTVSGGVIAGGPSARVSSNPGAANPATITWTRTMVWPYAKHGHAVKIINGVPWWALGDVGYPGAGFGTYTGPQQLGMYASPTAAGTSNSFKFGGGTVGYDAINFFNVTIGGQPCIVAESDDSRGLGAIAFPMVDQAAQAGNAIPLHYPPFPNVGTMRGLTFLPDGSMIYLLTGETVGKQPLDSIILSASPYDTCVVLDSKPVGTISNTTVCNGLYSNGYLWLGSWRIKVPGWHS